MGDWTVVDGDQRFVIETESGRISLDCPSGWPFVTNVDGIRDLRLKLGLAIGDAQES